MKIDLTDDELRRTQALADAAPDPTMRGVPKAHRPRVMALRVYEAGLEALEAKARPETSGTIWTDPASPSATRAEVAT